jgi:ubiquinone/menaquinone biosynthesis C-methylase UbiE
MINNILKTEYFNYINTNYFLTECQKKSILFYYNQRFKFFVENNSNKQIITFFKEANENNNIEEITRLNILFNHFINIELTNKVIEYLKSKKKISDSDIINYILKNIILDKKDKYNDKNIYKCDKWIYAIQYISLIYSNLIKLSKFHLKIDNKNIKYLDICCGNGKKTSIFQKSLNLNKDNTYCTDIDIWGPYKNRSKMPFQFKLIVDGHLDYEDNFFDLTTCILSLHHIKDLNNFINEIYRITKHGGFFILIEHSVVTDYDRLFINIQHLLYTVLYDNRKNFIENADFIYCYSMHEWNYMMMKNNFILKREEPLVFDTEFSFKYDNIFYALYQKK